MNFGTLAVIALVAVLGPLLALPRRTHLPVIVGELLAGIILGPTLLGYLDSADPTFTFLADIGFALIMFVAGSHVPMRDPAMRSSLGPGALRAGLVAILATAVGFGLAALFDTGNGPLYVVLMASSSAALILPIVDSLRLGGPPVVALLPQIALADTACIVALPLVIDPANAARAAVGALLVSAAAVLVFFLLRAAERSGSRKQLHNVSETRKFALELRISLISLFALAALAQATHVSIMLAGFALGLAVSAVGEPRRLAHQLFALTEGFLGPLFFVWLGCSLDLRDLGRHPSVIGLGLLLGLGAIVVHAVMRVLGQPLSLGVLAAAQLGVPVAAATVGTQLDLLAPGEAAAFLLGALVTIVASVIAGGSAVRAGFLAPPPTGKAIA
jgi:Kef-type K+ transport system membrane component KefB